ncbi:MAG: hypothetical protein U1F76_29305 [Candidatus Competibacteraceae bacterium]
MNAVLLDSFAQLQTMLDGHVALSTSTFAEPAFERLRSALATPRSRSPLDLAVLTRQALAYENGRRGSDNEATLRLPMQSSWPGPAEWRQVSVDAQRQQDEWHVRTTWWRPDWLPGTDIYPVDQAAMSARSCQSSPRTQLPTDAFLARVGVSTYRGSAVIGNAARFYYHSISRIIISVIEQ